MKFGHIAIGTWMTLFVGASAAEAQVTADQMTRGRPARVMTLRSTASVLYDSNVTQTSSGALPRGGLSKDDVIFTPGLSVNLVQPIGQQSLFLRGNAGYLIHDKNKSLDNSQFDVGGGAGGRLGPCGAVVTGAYSRGRSQLEDVALSETIDNILERERLGASATCVRAPGLGIQINVGQEWTQNSLPTTEQADSETITAGGGLILGRPAVSSVSAFGNYARTEYPNRPLVNGSADGFEVYSGGVTVERQIGARIQGRASVGYSRARMLEQPVPVLGSPFVLNTKFDGLTYSGNVTYRVSSRLRTEISLQRQIAPTLIRGQGYEVQSSYRVAANYKIGNRLSVGLNSLQSESNTRGITAAIVAPRGQTKSLVRTYATEITYTQTRRLSFLLTAAYSERDSDDPLFEYDGTRVGLTANFTY